jgi:hypothetical protein
MPWQINHETKSAVSDGLGNERPVGTAPHEAMEEEQWWPIKGSNSIVVEHRGLFDACAALLPCLMSICYGLVAAWQVSPPYVCWTTRGLQFRYIHAEAR